MQAVTEDVLRVLANPLVVNLSSDTAQTASGTASDAHACEQRMIRENGHRKAPTADGLAVRPLPEQARGSGVHERHDTTDTGCNEEPECWRITEDVETDREHEIECPDAR